MRKAEFIEWLLDVRQLQENTAQSYARRAGAIERKLGSDLDTDWARSRLQNAREQVENDPALGINTKADYKTALNAYERFCAT